MSLRCWRTVNFRWNLKCYCSIHDSPLMIHLLSWIHSEYFIRNPFPLDLNVTLLFKSVSSQWTVLFWLSNQRFVCISHVWLRVLIQFREHMLWNSQACLIGGTFHIPVIPLSITVMQGLTSVLMTTEYLYNAEECWLCLRYDGPSLSGKCTARALVFLPALAVPY
jgi:hypothetical protein